MRNYEFGKTFSHVLIQIQTDFVEDTINLVNEAIESLKKDGIKEEDFQRAKKRVYGSLVKDYNEVSTIATTIVSDYFRGINSFDYFEEFNSLNREYVEKILKEIFV